MKAQSVLSELGRNVLGLKLETSESVEEPDAETEALVASLVEERNEFRKAGQWQKADEIRSKLSELGVTLEDTPKGTIAIRKKKR